MGLVLGLLLLSFQPALAYTYTLASSGLVVHWKGQPYLPLVGNPKNLSRLTDQAVSNSVIRGLTRWKEASGGATKFDYWQGPDNSIFEPSSDFNGLSSFYFASNAKGGDKLPSNVIGLTQVWYNADSGEILEADITLNDIHYQFTTNPRDTSGNGLNTEGTGRNVYIENVLTHEIGHAFGLSHSGNLQATMLFMEAPEQAHLGCDERIGIHSLYPTSDQGRRGTIRGKVIVGPSSQGVFGAQVVAISRNRGTVIATSITDRRGEYVLNALEEGAYFIFVEPFFGGADVLPSYYSGANQRICDGGRASFGRTMLMDPVTNKLLSAHASGGGRVYSSRSFGAMF